MCKGNCKGIVLHELAASAALTFAIFALPLWSVSQPMPAPIMTSPSASMEERIVYISALETDALEEIATAAEPPSEPLEATATPAEAPTVEEAPAAAPAPVTEAAPPASSPLAPAVSAVAHAVPPPPEKRSRKRRKSARNCKPDVPQIRATGRARWDVERGLIDHYARDLKEASRLASVSWAQDPEGRVIGFKVHRVRCGSPLHEAGFENGDVITQINGKKVRTVPQALAAYVALRIKRKLRVRGTRRSGHPLDLRYRLT
jgi:membrane-associated protease RseP (regulator of RpoE activity)